MNDQSPDASADAGTPEPEPIPVPTGSPEPEASTLAPDAAAPEAVVDPDAPAAGFAALGLDPRILRTIAALGYEEPTPVQEAAIPPLLRGLDLLAEAPTGTGKTAAFALPILARIAARLDAARASGRPVENRGVPEDGRGARPSALVLTPTRELAMQVAEAVHRYGRELGVRVVPVYGGQPITTQLHRLARGVDVVVATPGRAVDHLDRGTLRFDHVETVVLDEADEMLDMGFADDLERILSALQLQRQTALFSATISGPIARLAESHLRSPARVRVEGEKPIQGEDARVRQVAYVVKRSDKLAALGRILDLEDGAATLVFARTRGEVDDLAEALSGRGRDAAALHGGLAQEQRDRIMQRFRDGALDVLVATDVAARGLDIGVITHVVNFDVPSSADTYVHRIGRTGRAGREGVAITLVEPREHNLLRNIERAVGAPLEIAGLPTVADMREHRMDLLRASLREALVAGGVDRYRGVVEALASEFDVVDIALAAVAMADSEARGAEDTTELAPAWLPQPFDRSKGGAGRRPRYGDDRSAAYAGRNRPRSQDPRNRGPWEQGRPYEPGGQGGPAGPGARPRPRPTGAPPPDGGQQQGSQWQGGQAHPGQWQGGQPDHRQPDRAQPYGGPQRTHPQADWQPEPAPDRGPVRPQRPAGAGPASGPVPAGPRRGYRVSGWRDNEGRPVMRAPNAGSGGPGGMTRLFVGAGRSAGMRPGDLVGAITNEAGLRGGDIGAIQIADGFSLVEVPADAADHVIRRLRGATIRGQVVTVRRERY